MTTPIIVDTLRKRLAVAKAELHVATTSIRNAEWTIAADRARAIETEVEISRIEHALADIEGPRPLADLPHSQKEQHVTR